MAATLSTTATGGLVCQFAVGQVIEVVLIEIIRVAKVVVIRSNDIPSHRLDVHEPLPGLNRVVV